MDKRLFRAGVAKKLITPRPEMGPVYRAGYKMGEAERITGVVDDIYARCLAVESEQARIVFLSLDLIGLFGDFTKALASKLGPRAVASAHLFVASTHMHSGPDTMGVWGPSFDQTGYNDDYAEFLLEASAEAVRESIDSARPADAFFVLEEADLGISNHREPGELSCDLWCLSFKDASGTLGSLVSYTAQPELAPRDDDRISAGYPGEACRVLDEKLGGTTLFMLGTCGGMEPEGCEKGYDEAHAYGRNMAKQILELQSKARPVRDNNLKVTTVEVELPVENPGFHLMMEAGVIRTSQRPPNLVTTMSRIEFSDINIYTVPGEAFPGITAGIGEPGRTLFINQVNDSLGYFIPPEQFRAEPREWAEGHHFIGHELESLGRTAGERIRAELMKLAGY